jgi:O-antigen chain-terminating methyltransferase
VAPADPKLEELATLTSGIRDRVRGRYPQPGEGQVNLPDLMPILHARDTAYAKVASIGSVNPRRGGPVNAVVQGIKKLVARALDWHVRDQVEFNRGVMGAIETILAALNENNRALRELAGRIDALQPLAAEVHDTRSHWIAWRSEWERKLTANETQFLRGLADLQTAHNHRTTLMEGNFRDALRVQHTDFTATLERTTLDIQKRLWADLERIRIEYESLIHTELRMVRQRATLLQAPAAPTSVPDAASPPPQFDSMKFAEKFRGPVEYVREGQRVYLEDFRGCENVLDLGCGRGEFLSLMKEAGIPARGVDLSEECVAMCRHQGLAAEKADIFEYLDTLPDQSLDGVFCAQVVEHLSPERVPELVRVAHAKLRRHGVLAIETPNPECLAIFSTHFYLDPTHSRPIPPALLVFYVEELGFGRIEVRRLAPAADSMPEVKELPEAFQQRFFGALDYAVVARRL